MIESVFSRQMWNDGLDGAHTKLKEKKETLV